MLNALRRAFCWALGEVKEKLDVRETWRELKKAGKKYGRRFCIAAVLWELFEDVGIPIILWNVGLPELIPVVLLLHGEPVVWPIFFFMFRQYDIHVHGESPYPDRKAFSNGYRTAAKTLLYRTLALGVFGLVLWKLGMSLWILTGYSLLMTFLNMVHERLWHDNNYGIVVETDEVEMKRTVAKALSYRVLSFMLSFMVMWGVFTALLGGTPWVPIITYQVTMLFGYFTLESFWAKNDWGIEPVEGRE